MEQRRFLPGARVSPSTVPGIAVADTESQPLALVYRGPASTDDCPEAVAALLDGQYRVAYIGPDEEYPLTAYSLAKAALYAQPGGGSLAPAWRSMRDYADDIRAYVQGGGNYVGFCLGGYLAGASPGFTLLPGDANEYVGSSGSDLDSTADTVLTVTWRGAQRPLFFQDGPLFTLDNGAPATVLATYPSGAVAAVVAPCGKGKVGVVGPHPEADETWFSEAVLPSSGAVHPELGRDLVATTVAR
ncbi:BPL-N domain-containing protein [Amycolatopsis panacis]|uniref:Biotin-protein ligase N-terminal domain-containing protein n=1 Tax=Amycolatopsis panacis TaxID=2340917 RepID=A0A419HY75_9PSEU|nr:BPL-N domain-containing protein [Amycolatopsis panacis]RJQ82121.1 hypothetical protein D5S19_22490 [Amycolatopsis panacis]